MVQCKPQRDALKTDPYYRVFKIAVKEMCSLSLKFTAMYEPQTRMQPQTQCILVRLQLATGSNQQLIHLQSRESDGQIDARLADSADRCLLSRLKPVVRESSSRLLACCAPDEQVSSGARLALRNLLLVAPLPALNTTQHNTRHALTTMTLFIAKLDRHLNSRRRACRCLYLQLRALEVS